MSEATDRHWPRALPELANAAFLVFLWYAPDTLDLAWFRAGVLSLLYRTGLPLAWFTNGQRVPEDIVSARAETLMATALDQQLDDCGIADDAMLVTWGRRIVNACQ